MKTITCIMTVSFAVLVAGTCGAASKGRGAELFNQHCASCHPDGGNIINPAKSLKKKELVKSGVKSAKDIVKKMRAPGPGMTTFDVKSITDKDAKTLADYILKTYK